MKIVYLLGSKTEPDRYEEPIEVRLVQLPLGLIQFFRRKWIKSLSAILIILIVSI